jgi:F-type H+-transporting ATPase subunit a
MNGAGGIVWLRWHGFVLRESLGLSLAISLLLVVLALGARHLIARPGQADSRLRTLVEVLYTLARDAVAEVVPPAHIQRVLPFISTLWLFILVANLAGLVPGLSSPTGDLSVTAALAVLVFFAVHAYGIRAAGLRAYLRQYLSPGPILLPFHIVSEITRTLALAIRLFGNIMSLEMAALLLLLVAGLLVPVPLLLLHVVEALVQAYIFGMLALIYIGGGLEAAQASEAATPRAPAGPAITNKKEST